ncbi:MAG: undecaprenyldiphospho-muramoylpentapeptide beta-N-acetylglucosaminyltransferase [Desulfovibrio sp.]|nr:undecaprenyldiphospho-muramoylpentapeptide beta-N-acetylglucosaminyltransferase [Desulfovibrio sp.]
MNRVLLTTGGTGGHIFPALAVAEELRRRFPEIELLFVGSQYGAEQRLTSLAGVPFKGLPVRGLFGRGLHCVGASFLMLVAVVKATGILHAFKPDAVVGFGGYAAFAPMFAARLLRIPSVLHEQNAVAGACNRFLSHMTQKICISLPETTGFDRKKCVVTGNPVRSVFSTLASKPERGDTRRLLVMGGSQGAHALNVFMAEHLQQFRHKGVAILHQTGKADAPAMRTAYAQAGYGEECVREFIDDVAEAYDWADLVLCRAGASTVAELCASGLPSVLVPFPYAIHDHQTQNALALEHSGASILVPESEMNARCLDTLLLQLLDAPEQRKRMSTAALAMSRPDAAAQVVTVLEQVVSGGQS